MHCTLPRFSRTALNIVAASDLHSQGRGSEIRFSTTQSGQRQIGAESAMIAINATLAQKTFAIRRMTILMALEQMSWSARRSSRYAGQLGGVGSNLAIEGT
jgi:hypothetical protein